MIRKIFLNQLYGCAMAEKCVRKGRKTRTVIIDIEQYKAMMSVKKDMMREERIAFYKQRKHNCETPNSFYKT
ncbi:MAG: transposase, partial [Mycoplasmataceae bacterium]|nr:transposase [Mycoplasmataceae bacterium]